MSISRVLLFLLFTGWNILVSLRLIGRATTWWKVTAFALLHAASSVLFFQILPHTALRFLAISATYFAYFMWIFAAELFPDALASYLTSLALQALGVLIFEPLVRVRQTYFGLPAFFSNLCPYLPLLIVTLFFLAQDRRHKYVDEPPPALRFKGVDLLIACGIFAIGCYLTTPVSKSLYLDVFLGGCLIAMPLSSYAVQRYAAKDKKTGKSLQYHIRQRATQKLAISILREERHEFINELTLISTYLQMGKYADAKTCLDYSSAKLADRNNYAALPHDAWLTVLELKQREAKYRQIDFRVDIRAKAPASFQEQRLLPKLIINLVDNAFHAVARQPDAQVSLSWSLGQDDERILRVSNNGPEVSPWDGKMIFRGGVTTKQEDSGNHGWGLVICKDIAGVLHGSLTYQSSPERTTFALTLPPAEQEVYEGLLEASF